MEWNTEIEGDKSDMYIDTDYAKSQLYSSTPDTKYSTWSQTNMDTALKASPVKSGKIINLGTTLKTKLTLSSYEPAFLVTSWLKSSNAHTPTFAAYLPTIQTSNGTVAYGREGTTMTLVCNIYKGPMSVAWFKDSSTTPLPNDGTTYDITTYVDYADSIVRSQIQLKSVNTGTEGTYSCAAGLPLQTSDPWPVRYYISVTVVGGTMLDAYGPMGEEVLITCTMPTMYTPDEVIWMKDGVAVTKHTSEVIYDAGTKNVWSVLNVSKTTKDDYGEYKAFIYFNRYTIEVETNTAKLYLLEISTPPSNTLAVTGRDMTLTCISSKPAGYTGGTSFTWRKSGSTNIPNSSKSSNAHTPTFAAYLPTIQTSNGTVAYGREGTTMTLVCNIYKGPMSVAWFKDSSTTPLPNDGTTYDITTYVDYADSIVRSQIQLKSVNTGTEGTYSCAAGLPLQTSDPWPVRYYISVTVVGGTMLDAYGPMGEEVLITCTMPTMYTPDEVIWMKDGVAVTKHTSEVIYDAGTKNVWSVLNVSKTTKDDYGEYKAFIYFNR
eukprot:sb/3463649/